MPSSYRPLWMLDTPGKVLEKLLKSRLPYVTDSLSPRQYGFRVGLSSMFFMVVLSGGRRGDKKNENYSQRLVLALDVKNAFNFAKWSHMLCAYECAF